MVCRWSFVVRWHLPACGTASIQEQEQRPGECHSKRGKTARDIRFHYAIWLQMFKSILLFLQNFVRHITSKGSPLQNIVQFDNDIWAIVRSASYTIRLQIDKTM